MAIALEEARRAGESGEVPVGAVLVKDGTVVAVGRNAPIGSHDPSAHAEVKALRAAGRALGNYRLDDCELFVTLEPCAMCAGAILHARLARVVFGAPDPKAGAAGSVLNLFAESKLNHRTHVQGGVLAMPCVSVLQDFFKARRQAAREAAEPLRDDALRTPADRFIGLGVPEPRPNFVNHLPSLHGWRMHYVDEGPRDARCTLLCLHGPGEWSFLFRHVVNLPFVRVLAPDLIGFGKSDKPKREAAHRLGWHRDVLIEWLDWLQPGQTVLVHSVAATEFAQLLFEAAPERFKAVISVDDGGDALDEAWKAPFPDRGYEAGVRALGGVAARVSGPTATQAQQLAARAMGYCTP